MCGIRSMPHSYLCIASAAESSHQVKPVFALQFLFGDSLDHVRKLLCDEAFEFAEGLLLKNCTYSFFFVGCALAENPFANFLNRGAGGSPKFLFHASMRWSSASFESLSLGSFKNSAIFP